MILIKIRSLIIFFLLVVFYIACAKDPSEGWLERTPGIDRRTGAKTAVFAGMGFGSDYEVGLSLGKSREGFKAFSVDITNESTQDLSDCVIIFNDRYKAALKDIYLGNPLGGSTLPRGKTISIYFNYNIDNYTIFHDGDIIPGGPRIPDKTLKPAQVMDRHKIPDKLTLQHASGIIDWDLTQAKNHPAKKGN